MGKIKGWSKRRDTYYEQKWAHRTPAGLHYVNVYYYEKDEYWVAVTSTTNRFRHRSQATKHAIDFMKKHPRG